MPYKMSMNGIIEPCPQNSDNNAGDFCPPGSALPNPPNFASPLDSARSAVDPTRGINASCDGVADIRFCPAKGSLLNERWPEQGAGSSFPVHEYSERGTYYKDANMGQNFLFAVSTNNGETATGKSLNSPGYCVGGGDSGSTHINKSVDRAQSVGILKGSKENLLQNPEFIDPNDGLGPLPEKWETAYTERGELYFIDHNTGTSHWLDPRLSKFQKKSLEDCCEDELPYGWEKIEDSLYGTYYIDHVNRRTQYENPVLEAKRRAAEQKEKSQSNGESLELSSQPEPDSTLLSSAHGGNTGNEKVEEKVTHQQTDAKLLCVVNSEDMAMPSDPACVGYEVPRNAALPYKFTSKPPELLGERIVTTLVKSPRGLGMTIIGGNIDEFLQIKTIIPNGPAWIDGKLRTGDVIIKIGDTFVLGLSHNAMVNIFQLVLPGQQITIEVCRGYPLPFDPNDPNTEVVTTFAVNSKFSTLEKRKPMVTGFNLDNNYSYADINLVNSQSDGFQGGFGLSCKLAPKVHTFSIVKGAVGFGFTIADSAQGQKVKQILDRSSCAQLQEGDILLRVNSINVEKMSHAAVVQFLKDCPKNSATMVQILRTHGENFNASSNLNPKLASDTNHQKNPIDVSSRANAVFRSKTPTADLYSTQPKEVLPIRPKTPVVDTRYDRLGSPYADAFGLDCRPSDQNVPDSITLLNGVVNGHREGKSHDVSSFRNLDSETLDHIKEVLSELKLTNKSKGEHILHLQSGMIASNRCNVTSNEGDYEARDYINPEEDLGRINNNNNNNVAYNLLPIKNHRDINDNGGVNDIYPDSNQIYQRLPHPHHESCFCVDCQNTRRKGLLHQHSTTLQHIIPAPAATRTHQNEQSIIAADVIHVPYMQKRMTEMLNDSRYIENGDSQGESQLHHAHKARDNQDQSGQYHPNYNQNDPEPLLSNGFGGRHLVMNSDCRPNTSKGLFLDVADNADQYELIEVTLQRRALGFGFRIVGGTEEGSQVSVGHLVPGGVAESNGRMHTGDEILSVDGNNVVNSSHLKVVSLVGESALRGQVTMILRRRVTKTHGQSLETTQTPNCLLKYPYDVIVSRQENEGFGFVIRSPSHQYSGSTIGELLPNSPADRSGKLNIGDRIIAVNRIDIADIPHGEIVSLIKESGLHVRLTIGPPLNYEIAPRDHDSCFHTLHKSLEGVQLQESSQLGNQSTLSNQQDVLNSEQGYHSHLNYIDHNRKASLATLPMNQKL